MKNKLSIPLKIGSINVPIDVDFFGEYFQELIIDELKGGKAEVRLRKMVREAVDKSLDSISTEQLDKLAAKCVKEQIKHRLQGGK